MEEFVLPSDVEDLFVEFSFRKSKWLQYGTYYTPQSGKYSNHFDRYISIAIMRKSY